MIRESGPLKKPVVKIGGRVPGNPSSAGVGTGLEQPEELSVKDIESKIIKERKDTIREIEKKLEKEGRIKIEERTYPPVIDPGMADLDRLNEIISFLLGLLDEVEKRNAQTRNSETMDLGEVREVNNEEISETNKQELEKKVGFAIEPSRKDAFTLKEVKIITNRFYKRVKGEKNILDKDVYMEHPTK